MVLNTDLSVSPQFTTQIDLILHFTVVENFFQWLCTILCSPTTVSKITHDREVSGKKLPHISTAGDRACTAVADVFTFPHFPTSSGRTQE